LQQREVREELRDFRRRRNEVPEFICDQRARDEGADDRKEHRRKVGSDELQVALPDQRERRFGLEFANGCQRLCGKVAADDEKSLNGDARVLVQPGKQGGQGLACRIGDRAVKSQMVENDQLRGDRLDGIDEGKSRVCSHLTDGPASTAPGCSARRRERGVVIPRKRAATPRGARRSACPPGCCEMRPIRRCSPRQWNNHWLRLAPCLGRIWQQRDPPAK
jgi:hypothetical protein